MMSIRSISEYSPSAAANRDYVAQRLRGTVWERVRLAAVLYRATLSFGQALGRLGVSADGLTYTSLLFATAAGLAAAFGSFPLAAGLVVASGICDLLDGVVARATHTDSTYGALLDSAIDRLADALPLLGLVAYYADEGAVAAIPALAIVGGFTVSYVRARSEGLGVRLPPLFMRRAERVSMVTASLLLGLVALPSLPVRAPLLLVGIALIALLGFVASGWALHSARVLLGERRTGAGASPRAAAIRTANER